MFLLELSKEELSIIAGALYTANDKNVKQFVDKYDYPCAKYDLEKIIVLQDTLSEKINKLIEDNI